MAVLNVGGSGVSTLYQVKSSSCIRKSAGSMGQNGTTIRVQRQERSAEKPLGSAGRHLDPIQIVGSFAFGDFDDVLHT